MSRDDDKMWWFMVGSERARREREFVDEQPVKKAGFGTVVLAIVTIAVLVAAVVGVLYLFGVTIDILLP